MIHHYDLIIIGSGAGGSTLAYALAPTGQQILILERGDFVPQEDANWDADQIFLERRYQVQERWLDSALESFNPEAYYVVGGNTKFYGAALQRMRQEDFGELPHCDGVSPAWPLSYEVFEPYYVQAESLYGIHGCRGEDPTEPPMSTEYPFPPLPHEPRIQAVADQLTRQGLSPFHLTMAVDRNVQEPDQGACIRCQTCDPFPCKLHAKWDAEVACLRPALAYPNVTLITGAYVERLETNPEGSQVERVVVHQGQNQRIFSADRVVVACGAINSAALLLRSASAAHPQGLANGSGMVGRNLMFHNHSALVAVADEPNPTIFQKTLGLHDYYFQGPNQPYPLGQIQLTGKAPWERLKAMAPDGVPQDVLEFIAGHCINWWITTEDLPDPNNRVLLTADGDLQICYQPNNLKPHQELMQVLETHLKSMGFYLFWHKYMDLPTVWHQAGTCRFGEDPTHSVLDLNCRTHEVANLYVVDASFFPAMGAVNPTLTIIANALRVAAYLKDKSTYNNA